MRFQGTKYFGFFNTFKVIKQLTVTLNKLYSCPKKLKQLMTSLFLLANSSWPNNSKLRKILHPLISVVNQLALGSNNKLSDAYDVDLNIKL